LGTTPAVVDPGRFTLLAASGATALLLLDVTAVNVALPEIRDSLDASFSDLQWVVDAYALTLAAVLLSAGSLADRVGRRAVFLGGLAIFALASLACGLATTPLALNAGRALQGLGGAAMFACSLALIADRYRAPRERGRALGVWGAITGAALAAGPPIGGAIVDGLGWEWVFLLNLPLVGVLAVLTIGGVGESRDPEAPRLDVPGVVAFTAACFLLVLALVRGNAEGWGSPLIVGSLTAGALLLALFAWVELRSPAPMLDLRLFRIPPFAGTAIVAFAQSFALYPMLLFVALWLQSVLGFGALETGVRMLPVTATLLVVAPLSGLLTGRVPLRLLLSTGLLLIAAGLLVNRRVDAGSDWTALLPGLFIGGLGIGVISPALAAAMVSVLSVERVGLASGVNNTFRQLGIAAGIALLGAVFDARVDDAADVADGFAAGLDAVFLIGALVALAAVPAALLLIRNRPLAAPLIAQPAADSQSS
jgi:EmrB/QacA subfamily drug resistance transporter